jgi:O-antigen/teichoic acid export membrane protein
LPFLPVTAFLWAMRYSDRMFVSAFMKNADVAVYDVAARTGAIAGFFVPGIALAWPQFAFSRLSDPNRDAIYKAALTIITAVTCAVAIYVAVLRRQLLHAFAPPAYQGGSAVVVLISVSQIPFAIYYVASTGLKLSKETGLIAWSAGAAALVHVVISAVLTPRSGIIGPAVATVCSTSVLAILMCLLGQKRANIIDVAALVRIAAIALLAAVATSFADGVSRRSAILNVSAIALVSLAVATVLRTAIGHQTERNHQNS